MITSFDRDSPTWLLGSEPLSAAYLCHQILLYSPWTLPKELKRHLYQLYLNRSFWPAPSHTPHRTSSISCSPNFLAFAPTSQPKDIKMTRLAIFFALIMSTFSAINAAVLTPEKATELASIIRQGTECSYTSTVTAMSISASCSCEGSNSSTSSSSSSAPAAYYTCLDNGFRANCNPNPSQTNQQISDGCCISSGGSLTTFFGFTFCRF